jgi:hypothetical protein
MIKDSLPGVLAFLQGLAFDCLKRVDQIMILPLPGFIAFKENPQILFQGFVTLFPEGVTLGASRDRGWGASHHP